MRTIEVVSEKLIEKYGAPTAQMGRWPSHEQIIRYFVAKQLGTIEGDRMWKTEDQMIRENLFMACGYVSVVVNYRPPAPKKSGEL